MEDRMKFTHPKTGKTISALAFDALPQTYHDFQNWEWIKKAKLLPRVETFWWRIFCNAIQTFIFLRRLQGRIL